MNSSSMRMRWGRMMIEHGPLVCNTEPPPLVLDHSGKVFRLEFSDTEYESNGENIRQLFLQSTLYVNQEANENRWFRYGRVFLLGTEGLGWHVGSYGPHKVLYPELRDRVVRCPFGMPLVIRARDWSRFLRDFNLKQEDEG